MTLLKTTLPFKRWAFFSLIFCSLFAFTACDTASKTASPDQVETYSGKDLFKGLIFGAGDAAHLFDEVWQTDQITQYATQPEEKALANEYDDELAAAASDVKRAGAATWFVERIEQANPSFFSEFETAMKSGNHLQIQNALIGAGEVIRDLAAEEVGEEALLARSPDELETLAAQSKAQPIAGLYVYSETAVAAAAVAVVVVVAFAIDFTPVMSNPDDPTAERDEPSLLFEEGVDYIATTLRTSPR